MLLTTVSYMYARTASLAGHREYYIWTQKLKTESMLMVKKKKKNQNVGILMGNVIHSEDRSDYCFV